MGERGEIAGRANGALAWYYWHNAPRQHALDKLTHVPTNSGSASAQRQELQRHDETHFRFIERITDTAAMAEDQIALKGLRVARGYADARKLSETGVDPVNAYISDNDGADAIAALFDDVPGVFGQFGTTTIAPKRFEQPQIRVAGCKEMVQNAPPKNRR